MPRIAIYPGSFDPITNGHIDVIRRASCLFDRVIVAVLSNTEKQGMFTVPERLELIKASTMDIANLEYDSFDGLLVDYAAQKKVAAIVRGLRVVSDFDYEFQMAMTNRQISPQLETVFLMTDAKYSFLSSSLVRQLAQFHGTINQFVPGVVVQALEKKFRG
jgi:pantetheine-phosphate adenylyltransferase